jgi:hypothetical protein
MQGGLLIWNKFRECHEFDNFEAPVFHMLVGQADTSKIRCQDVNFA